MVKAATMTFRNNQAHPMVIDPRNGGRAKVMRPAPVAHGMKNVSASATVKASAFHHGIAEQDVPNTVKSLGQVGIHPGTPEPNDLCRFVDHLHPVRRAGTDTSRGKPGNAGAVLTDAGNLGNPNIAKDTE